MQRVRKVCWTLHREIGFLVVGLTIVYAVSGITPGNMQAWKDAGVAGFGIGSNLYKQGFTAAEAARSAKEFVAAWRALKT